LGPQNNNFGRSEAAKLTLPGDMGIKSALAGWKPALPGSLRQGLQAGSLRYTGGYN